MRTSGFIDRKSSVMALLTGKLLAVSAGFKQKPDANGRVDFNLNRGEVERLHQSSRWSRIECNEGCVWITQSGCAEDIILQKGQVYDCAGDGTIVMEAISSAKVTLRA